MKRISIIVVVLVLTSVSALAQQAKFTAADYARAEKMLGFNTSPLVDRAGVRPTFLPDGRFWYRVLTSTGSEFVLVNPSDGSRAVGDSLSKIGVTSAAPAAPTGRTAAGTAVLSPDGKKAAYIKDYNLWVRDVATGRETQLTTDGIKDFGYATDNAGWRQSSRAILLWSPDSKKIATYQQDQRHVSDMYLVTTNVGAPKLEAWKYPLPQDKDVILIHRVIIEVDEPRVIRLKIGPDPRRGTLCDDISCTGKFDDNEWSPDATKLAFVSSSRDHKQAKFRIADAATGDVREVFEEVVPTQYESGQGAINWRYLPATNEAIWYSERDDWGHLYLYDLNTGKPKHQITKGDFVVMRLLKMDEKARVLYFEAETSPCSRPRTATIRSHFRRTETISLTVIPNLTFRRLRCFGT
jgi:dipeptidyl-peptidase 4